jgi:signal transduction histidine kinase
MPLLGRPSLRLKMTLWFLAIFTIAFSAVLISAWLLHRQTTRVMLDERLTDLARGVGEMVQHADKSPWMDRFQSLQPTERTFVVLAVRDGDGTVLASQWLVDTDALPPIPDRLGSDLVIRPLPPESARRLLGRPLQSRIVTHRSVLADGSVRYIDLATASDLAQEERSFLVNAFVVGGLGAVLASGLAAWLISGRAVRPMKLLAHAAEQVDPEHISDRLVVEGDEHEVEQLRAALNRALTRLEDGYRAQERFISNVAHDLKTPIAVMLAESQVLRSRGTTLEELRRYRDSTIAEMRRLGGLVESFLTLARADQGEALGRMMEVPINDLVMDAVAECDLEADQHRVRLITTLADPGDGGAEVRGDPDLLRTMLVNLIRNAIRHSPPVQPVDITVHFESDAALISVRDRGPGIPEEYREAVFDRFVRVPSEAGRGSGTGLGLAIAKSVVQMHGGSIKLEQGPGGGCLFTASLPLAAAGAAPEPGAAAEDAASPRPARPEP